MTTAPIYCEFTPYIPSGNAVYLLPKFAGPIAETGAAFGFAPNDPDPRKLADLWCGPNNEHALRLARELGTMPSEHRVALVDGWFGCVPKDKWGDEAYKAEHRRQTIEAVRRIAHALDSESIELDGLIVDAEYDRHVGGASGKAAHLKNLFYVTGGFEPNHTDIACWNVWDGKHAAKNEWGDQEHTPLVIDGWSAVVHGYIEVPHEQAMRGPGPADWEAETQEIVKAAQSARDRGYEIVPLIATLTHDHSGRPYPGEAVPHISQMIDSLARIGVKWWWVFNAPGAMRCPMPQTWLDAVGKVRSDIKDGLVKADAPAETILRLVEQAGSEQWAGNWRTANASLSSTVSMIRAVERELNTGGA